MRQSYQDAMTLVRHFGKPDLFITFTANPAWREISENLKPGEIYLDRPDLCARVFMLKWKEFKKDVFEKHVLGNENFFC